MAAGDEALTFGQRLRRARKLAELQQKQLAPLAQVSRQYLSELENDKHPRPGREIVERLAAVLGVPADSLRIGEHSPQSPTTRDSSGRGDVLLAPPGSRAVGMGTDQPGMRYRVDLAVPAPFLGRANAGDGGGDVAEGEVIDVAPSLLEGHARVGVVQIVGACMEPEVRDGDHVFVDPDASPKMGDHVLVRVKATGELIYKIWFPQDAEHVVLVPAARGVGKAQTFELDEIEYLGVGFALKRPIEGLRGLRLASYHLTLLGGGGTSQRAG